MHKLIIAPHVDDEVIGCWSVFGTGDITVLYLYELDAARKAEAEAAALALDFTPAFGDISIVRAGYDEVYVPSRRDWHADHKAANAQFRSIATHFYSVDMKHGKLLDSRDSKLAFLNKHYPSQKSLWETDAKYWLFEDIQLRDYDVYQTFTAAECSITVLTDHAVAAEHLVKNLDTLNMHTIMDNLISFCKGRVTVSRATITMESE